MKVGVDYTGVCVTFFCHDGNGNILLHKRSKNCRDEHGRWDCGGGRIEFGEDWEHAVKREIKEEYCAPVQSLQFAGVSNVIRKHDGKKTHWIALIYAVKLDPEKVKIGEPKKMTEIGWFSPGKFPKPLHSMFLRHFEVAKKFIPHL